jgi:hypothetical protein
MGGGALQWAIPTVATIIYKGLLFSITFAKKDKSGTNGKANVKGYLFYRPE